MEAKNQAKVSGAVGTVLFVWDAEVEKAPGEFSRMRLRAQRGPGRWGLLARKKIKTGIRKKNEIGIAISARFIS